MQDETRNKQLFELLCSFRNSIGAAYYSNWKLDELATEVPVTKDAFLKVAPDKDQFDSHGHRLLALIRKCAALEQIFDEEQSMELFETLRLFRNSIFRDHSSYYPNSTLTVLAGLRPVTEQEFLELAPDRGAFDEYGHRFLRIIQDVVGSPQPEAQRPGDDVRAQVVKIELALHAALLDMLQQRYGEQWWYEGVPEPIRKRCASLHEETRGNVPKEDLVYLIDLQEIAVGHWALAQALVDPDSKGKKSFQRRMRALNDIRNRLSHPVRLKKSPITEEDRTFVAELYRLFCEGD